MCARGGRRLTCAGGAILDRPTCPCALVFSVLALASVARTSCLLPSEAVAQLALSLTLSDTRMHPDTGVLVRVEAINRTTHVVHLETMGGCIVRFGIVAPDNANVGPRFGCPAILRRRSFAPGEAAVLEYLLFPTPRWDADLRKEVRWPAGTYQVFGYLVGKDVGIVRRTEPLEFELVCRDPSWTEC